MNRFLTKTFTGAMRSLVPAARRLVPSMAIAMIAAVWLATPACADPFVFDSVGTDGLLGGLSQPANANHVATETADDFILSETTSITEATVIGLIPAGTALTDVVNVEVEIYHVFPRDSADPPSGRVPSRVNSPADDEIDSATRDSSAGTLDFSVSLLDDSFTVLNTVVDGVLAVPNSRTGGEGAESGRVVEITMTFDPPIVLPADHYFFRPEVEVTGGDFLYLSAPKPIPATGTPFEGDLQAWIRNSDLTPDWLRIGTDIVGGNPAPTFNMALSLTGETDSRTVVSNDGGCAIGSAGSTSGRALWLLLAPAAALAWTRRRQA